MIKNLKKKSTEAFPLTDVDLRALALAAGAHDAALVSLDHPSLAGEREHAQHALPGARYLLSYCVRTRREAIRSPARSIANHEFHHAGDEVGDVGRELARILEDRGIRSLVPPMGFPQEMEHFPGRIWTIQHKTAAEASGLGVMGIHRLVIHPKFGNFILLGTLVIAEEVQAAPPKEIASPCFECKLCVAACPVGAIRADGYFDFSACYTHNYREFMGGFTDWVEHVVDSKNAKDYRKRVTDSESASMWQSLSSGSNYKAAYCMAVCPAGEDVIGAYEEDKGGFVRRVVKPLQAREEPVYVMPGTDAEEYVKKRFPNKHTRPAGSVLRPVDLDSFLGAARHVFQRDHAMGLDAVYHFRFRGAEVREATITIRDQKLTVEEGLLGKADLRVTADTDTWVRFLRKEVSIVRALLTAKVRLKGPPKLLVAFGRCFP